MEHPLIHKVQIQQDPSDKRPHHEWLNEQLALGEEMGGEFTWEEVEAYLDEYERAQALEGRLQQACTAPAGGDPVARTK
ncbi:MAG: hypothetical protein Q4E06_01230 [Lautropia sp.]|nr:hypothetical protein [Lautropia sp.]